MIRQALVAAVFMMLLPGCGGAPAPARDATDLPSDGNASEEASHDSSAEGPEADSSDAAEAAEPSPDDLRTVLQLVVDDEEINRSLHLDKAGRFPLKLSGEVPKDLKLTNGNHGVVIVDEPKSEKDPVLVITKIDIDGKRANIGFRYDVESIRGTARYKKTSSGWELANVRVIQH